MTVSPVLASCVRDIPVPAEHSHVSDGGSGGGDGEADGGCGGGDGATMPATRKAAWMSSIVHLRAGVGRRCEAEGGTELLARRERAHRVVGVVRGRRVP